MRVIGPGRAVELLRRHGLKPRKSWGQNFLTNGDIAKRLIQALELTGEEPVLEVGPGLGMMTELLLELSPQVSAIEIDPLLCEFLADRFGQRANFTLVSGDALAQDFARLMSGGYCFMANLPYYITSPLLVKLLEQPGPPARAVLVLQLEVARRLVAEPGTKEYGALSLLIQYHCQAEMLFKIGPGNFHPQPQVDSGAVRLLWRPPLYRPRDEKFMFSLVKLAFGQRRKMLKGLLAKALAIPTEEVTDALTALGHSENIRGEELSVRDFALLADSLKR